MAHYATKADAIAAGYVPARVGIIEPGIDADIRIVDISGHTWFGYVYAVIVAPTVDAMDRAWRAGTPIPADSPRMAVSETVWTDERNRAGNLGAYCVMFRGDRYADGLATARAWRDGIRVRAWLAENQATIDYANACLRRAAGIDDAGQTFMGQPIVGRGTL